MGQVSKYVLQPDFFCHRPLMLMNEDKRQKLWKLADLLNKSYLEEEGVFEMPSYLRLLCLHNSFTITCITAQITKPHFTLKYIQISSTDVRACFIYPGWQLRLVTPAKHKFK